MYSFKALIIASILSISLLCNAQEKSASDSANNVVATSPIEAESSEIERAHKNWFNAHSIDFRKKIQQVLYNYGLYNSSIDGLWGANTSNSINAFIEVHSATLITLESEAKTITSVQIPDNLAGGVKLSDQQATSNNANQPPPEIPLPVVITFYIALFVIALSLIARILRPITVHFAETKPRKANRSKYGTKTCYDCGLQTTADKMTVVMEEVANVGSTSRSSINPMTIIGAALGVKEAQASTRRFIWNTSRRVSSSNVKAKRVWKCNYCAKTFTAITKVTINDILNLFILVKKITSGLWSVIFYVFDLFRKKSPTGNKVQKKKPNVSTLLDGLTHDSLVEVITYVLLKHIASVDGKFSIQEKRYIFNILDLDDDEIELAELIMEDPNHVDSLLDIMAQNPIFDDETKLTIISKLCELAGSDGTFSKDEHSEILIIMQKLDVTENELQDIFESIVLE